MSAAAMVPAAVVAGAARRLDGWMFAPGSPRRLEAARRLLAAVIALRVALGPYRGLAGQPDALFLPRGVIDLLLDAMPPLGVIVMLQLAGVVAAAAVIVGRGGRPALVVAWVCLVILAGLRGSLGKILHNDVLLVLAAVPLVAAPGGGRRRAAPEGAGWPLRAAAVVVAGSYVLAGVAKLRHSGLAWVTGDNMVWVMTEAARDPRGLVEGAADFLAGHPALARLAAAGILALELGFALVLWRSRLAPWFVAGAAVFHAGTWITLGLDYWAQLAVVAVVLVDWEAFGPRRVEPVPEMIAPATISAPGSPWGAS